MKRLHLNKEYLARHLFAVLVFAAMGAWFSLDAFARYPRTPAAALYETIEKAPPPPAMDRAALEAFKAQKVATQKIMAFATLAVAAFVGLRLLASARFSFSFDEAGFASGSKRRAWSDVKETDDRLWEKKRIFSMSGDGWKISLDAWHHAGVEEARATALAAKKEKT